MKTLFIKLMLGRFLEEARNFGFKMLQELIEKLIAKHESKLRVDVDQELISKIIVKILRDHPITNDERKELMRAGIDIIIANKSIVK